MDILTIIDTPTVVMKVDVESFECRGSDFKNLFLYVEIIGCDLWCGGGEKWTFYSVHHYGVDYVTSDARVQGLRWLAVQCWLQASPLDLLQAVDQGGAAEAEPFLDKREQGKGAWYYLAS